MVECEQERESFAAPEVVTTTSGALAVAGFQLTTDCVQALRAWAHEMSP
jgi:hypothetical protein